MQPKAQILITYELRAELIRPARWRMSFSNDIIVSSHLNKFHSTFPCFPRHDRILPEYTTSHWNPRTRWHPEIGGRASADDPEKEHVKLSPAVTITMISFTFRRLLKYTLLSLGIVALLGSLQFAHNQTRFQAFLKNQYITWADFPSSYADALRAKDWDTLLQTYDYKTNFPTIEYNTEAGGGAPTKNIPPIIHFIWFRNLYETKAEITSIPSQGSEAPEHCRKYNPDYTINIWNASAARDLLEEHYAWFLPTYDAYRYPIQRVDAIKYFLLWHYGGIYMDMDIACRRSMDPLLGFPAWFPEASPLGVNNDLMATRARHPVIRLMLESLSARNLNLIFPYLTIFWSTGPQFTGDLLKRWFLKFGGKYVVGESKVDAGESSLSSSSSCIFVVRKIALFTNILYVQIHQSGSFSPKNSIQRNLLSSAIVPAAHGTKTTSPWCSGSSRIQ
jgi:mannosyltransferase OCH1-like enzyme